MPAGLRKQDTELAPEGQGCPHPFTQAPASSQLQHSPVSRKTRIKAKKSGCSVKTPPTLPMEVWFLKKTEMWLPMMLSKAELHARATLAVPGDREGSRRQSREPLPLPPGAGHQTALLPQPTQLPCTAWPPDLETANATHSPWPTQPRATPVVQPASSGPEPRGSWAAVHAPMT